MNEIHMIAHQVTEILVVVGRFVHFPVMVGAFLFGITLRSLVYQTIRRHFWFAREFEARVTEFLSKENDRKSSNVSFYVVTKRLLERSYYEVFAQREKVRRTQFDTLVLKEDRIFLTKYGCAWYVKELLKQIRFLQFGNNPKIESISRTVLGKNPAFNRVLGIIPVTGVNDLLNILPGLFVIGGIFGTFLGVMTGLPQLSGMDLNDPEKTKLIMDQFLGEVAISMGSSILGIFLSVVMTIFNTIFSPERVYGEMAERFENAFDLLWNYATNNEVPSGLNPFKDTVDPIEALAEATLTEDYEKSRIKSA